MDTTKSLTPEQEVAPHAEVTLQQDAKCNAEQDSNNVRATTETTAEKSAFTQGAERSVGNVRPFAVVEDLKGPGSVDGSGYYPTRDEVALLASARQLHTFAAIHGYREEQRQLGEGIATFRKKYSDEAWEASERNVQELEKRNRAELAEKQANGSGSVEFSDYHPSRYELTILACHWETETTAEKSAFTQGAERSVGNGRPIAFLEDIKGPGSVECSEYYPTRDAVGLLASMRQLHEYAAIHGERELEQQLGERIAALRQMYSDEAWEASERNVQELEKRNRAEVAENQEATSEDDRALLGPIGGNIGLVDQVNGPGSVEFSDYHPSRYELGILAKHWLDVRLSTHAFCWFYACSGSTEIRILPYSMRRLNRIADILGDETFARLEDEVEDKYRQKYGDEGWAAFQQGDRVWRDRELERIYAEEDKQDRARSAGGANADPAPEQVAAEHGESERTDLDFHDAASATNTTPLD